MVKKLGVLVKEFFTDGEIFSEDNKARISGWVWYDESPEGFLRWMEDNELQ